MYGLFAALYYYPMHIHGVGLYIQQQHVQRRAQRSLLS